MKVITPEQLMQALVEQKSTKKRLGAVLIDLGFLNETALVEALSIQLARITTVADGPQMAAEVNNQPSTL